MQYADKGCVKSMERRLEIWCELNIYIGGGACGFIIPFFYKYNKQVYGPYPIIAWALSASNR